jgi:uncharacterized protein (TIGR00299 family) protein
MKILYIDSFCGMSGDMLLAAMFDAGADEQKVREGLKTLAVDGWTLEVARVRKGPLAACKATVHVDGFVAQPHRHLNDIVDMIEGSRLTDPVKQKSVAVFRKLAEAEARVHGTTPEKIHFHEVGAVDSIVDVVGTVLAVSLLAPTKIVCSPVHVGSGEIECAHGTLPVPAPATLTLLQGVPVYSTGIKAELVTPTGAALVTTLADEFGPLPAMTPTSVGYGAGTRDIEERSNVLRAVVGETSETMSTELSMAVVETNIDDMNPELYQPLVERLFDAGARDVFMTPVYGKKQRPGTLLTIICPEETVPEMGDILFRETTTFGVRHRVERRMVLDRVFKQVETPWGEVTVKVGAWKGANVTVAPEFDSCLRVAEQAGVPVGRVRDAAMAAYARDNTEENS